MGGLGSGWASAPQEVPENTNHNIYLLFKTLPSLPLGGDSLREDRSPSSLQS